MSTSSLSGELDIISEISIKFNKWFAGIRWFIQIELKMHNLKIFWNYFKNTYWQTFRLVIFFYRYKQGVRADEL